MSFLRQIQQVKLRPVDTVITCVDGTQYLETKDAVSKMANRNYGFVVDNRPDDKPALIVENLYLGSQDCCFEEPLLEYNIKNVLSLGIEGPVRIEGIGYNFIPCLDLPETNIWEIVDRASPIIKSSLDNNEAILVHCNAGVSRSASVVIGYLMLSYNYDFEKAFQMVRLARNCIKPNCGFESQLRNM